MPIAHEINAELTMHYMRQMNYTAFSGETRTRAEDLVEAIKWASWSRGRPGHHDDVKTEDLPGVAEGVAGQFDALWQEHRAQQAEIIKAQLATAKAHAEAVAAEVEYWKQPVIEGAPAPDFHAR